MRKVEFRRASSHRGQNKTEVLGVCHNGGWHPIGLIGGRRPIIRKTADVPDNDKPVGSKKGQAADRIYVGSWVGTGDMAASHPNTDRHTQEWAEFLNSRATPDEVGRKGNPIFRARYKRFSDLPW